MQVNTNYNSPTFGKFLIGKSAAPALKKLSKAEKVQIGKWQRELADTKHFDLQLTAQQHPYEDYTYLRFLHKTNPELDSEAPLYPRKTKGKLVDAYGIDILDCGDKFSYRFNVKSEERAAEILQTLKAHGTKPKTLFNKIAWAVDSTKFLDEGASNGSVKLGIKWLW